MPLMSISPFPSILNNLKYSKRERHTCSYQFGFTKERMTQKNKCTHRTGADVVKLLIRITDQKGLPSRHKLFRSPTPDDLRECLHKYAEEKL